MESTIDDAIDYEKEYKKYLPNAKKNRNSLITRCRFNDDDKPSFSIDTTTVYQELCDSYDIK